MYKTSYGEMFDLDQLNKEYSYMRIDYQHKYYDMLYKFLSENKLNKKCVLNAENRNIIGQLKVECDIGNDTHPYRIRFHPDSNPLSEGVADIFEKFIGKADICRSIEREIPEIYDNVLRNFSAVP